MFNDTVGILFTSGLSGFLLETFARVPDSLVLVRIRLLKPANVGRNLPDLLPVHPADDKLGLFIYGDTDSGRNRIFDRMGVSKREKDRILSLFGAVSDTHDLQFLGEAFG